jgi:Tfp pilus assembly protein PilV
MVRNGFTLIEALITTVVLVTGLTAVAGVFSYSSVTSLRVRQHTSAVLLVSAKLEALRIAEDLAPGRDSEFLNLAPDGTALVSSPGATYLRSWEITSEMPRRVTVIVHGKPPGRRGPYFELARATTKVGRRF